jgi:hypothetical protein
MPAAMAWSVSATKPASATQADPARPAPALAAAASAAAAPAIAAAPTIAAAVWHADQLARTAGAAAAPPRPTGFAALDAELPGGGWPGAGLTELLHDGPGGGELRLLAPALAAAAAPLLWVAPPLQPYAPALMALGLAPERLIIAAPERAADAAWAVEQALRSGALGAVLWWPGAAPVAATLLRRLHLAALEGRTAVFAFRRMSVRTHSSPALLRMTIEPRERSRLAVDVFKRRGPPLAAPLLLDLPGPPLPLRRARRLPPPQPAPLPTPVQEDALACPVPGRAAA